MSLPYGSNVKAASAPPAATATSQESPCLNVPQTSPGSRALSSEARVDLANLSTFLAGTG